MKDLMIGDWLRYNGSPYRVIQITCASIPDDEFYGWMLENGVEDKGEPIPLTPEILRINGWKGHGFSAFDDFDFFTEDEEELVELTIKEDNSVWWTISYDEYQIIRLRYVHELQHVIRLCGVNKEIVL